MKELETKTIEIGSQHRVIVDKMFGPTVFVPLRITPDLERGWVIERMWASSSDWIEWCTIPAQIDQEFTEDGSYYNKESLLSTLGDN